jgi:hypothetical protein
MPSKTTLREAEERFAQNLGRTQFIAGRGTPPGFGGRHFQALHENTWISIGHVGRRHLLLAKSNRLLNFLAFKNRRVEQTQRPWHVFPLLKHVGCQGLKKIPKCPASENPNYTGTRRLNELN